MLPAAVAVALVFAPSTAVAVAPPGFPVFVASAVASLEFSALAFAAVSCPDAVAEALLLTEAFAKAPPIPVLAALAFASLSVWASVSANPSVFADELAALSSAAEASAPLSPAAFATALLPVPVSDAASQVEPSVPVFMTVPDVDVQLAPPLLASASVCATASANKIATSTVVQ
jgi:hypothetical protein